MRCPAELHDSPEGEPDRAADEMFPVMDRTKVLTINGERIFTASEVREMVEEIAPQHQWAGKRDYINGFEDALRALLAQLEGK